MSLMESWKTCFKKYCNFSGRARRSEFWWFQIIPWILNCGVTILFQWKLAQRAAIESQIGEALFDQDKMDALMKQAESVDSAFTPFLIVIGILWLLILLPSLGVLVRRLHDTGRTGWLILLMIIPIVNLVVGILLLVWTLQDSQKGANKYGPSPKYVQEGF